MEKLFLPVFISILANITLSAQHIYPFQDTSFSDDQRLDNLLNKAIQGNFFIALKLGLLDADQTKLPYAHIGVMNNSQELGNGLADVIFGEFNPVGRTIQTWVKSITNLPPMMDYNIRNGRTYMYAKAKSLYPFGYGLSYTHFFYSNIKLSSSNISRNQSLTVSVNVENTGSSDGEEVVQLYVSFPDSRVERPIKQLKSFEQIMISKGEAKLVYFELLPESFSYWDKDRDEFVVESGKVNIILGSSSEDIRIHKQIRIKE